MPWWGTVLISLISALGSGGFALLGVAIADRRTRKRDEIAFRRQTALSLPDLEPLMWGEELRVLHAALSRVETSMLVAGLSKEHANRLVLAHLACWYDADRTRTGSGGERAGILSELLQAREISTGVARELLLAEPGQAVLPAPDAIANADAALRAAAKKSRSAYLATRVRLLPDASVGAA